MSSGPFRNLPGHRRGRADDVADVVALHGLDERIGDRRAIAAARDDHREFLDERTKGFDEQLVAIIAAEFLPRAADFIHGRTVTLPLPS